MTTKSLYIICMCVSLFSPSSGRSEQESPQGDRCLAYGYLAASYWHKTDFCVSIRPALQAQDSAAKAKFQSAYPKLVESLHVVAWSENIKQVSLFSVYEDKEEDPKFSKTSCQRSVDEIGNMVTDKNWNKVLACWK